MGSLARKVTFCSETSWGGTALFLGVQPTPCGWAEHPQPPREGRSTGDSPRTARRPHLWAGLLAWGTQGGHRPCLCFTHMPKKSRVPLVALALPLTFSAVCEWVGGSVPRATGRHGAKHAACVPLGNTGGGLSPIFHKCASVHICEKLLGGITDYVPVSVCDSVGKR